MELIKLESFYNYVDAHLLKSRLESEEIECWLEDENTGTINPGYANIFGGIKLLVKKEDFERAKEIMNENR